MKQRVKKLVCLIILSAVIFTCLLACSKGIATFKNETAPDNDSIKESEDYITKIIGENALGRDLAEVSCLNGIVKIDSITSGLDVYSFDTILFDLQKNEKLCEVSFVEGAWVSGLTQNGFYVANTLTKELKIYDRAGNVTKEHVFSDVAEPVLFCALSENEKYFLYTNSVGMQATVIHLVDNKKTIVDLDSPPREALSFKDGILKLVSISGEVFELDVAKESYTLVLADKRINRFSSYYSLGETESNFLLENEKGCFYVPISSADEIVVGMGEHGFATTCVSQDKNQLRFYDLNKKTVSYYYTTEPVEKICFVDEQRALAVTGSPMEKRHKILLCRPASPEELTVLSRDIPLNATPEHSASHEPTATPSKLIGNVTAIPQFPKFPTGCESVTAVMALNYFGKQISVEEFVDEFLPTSRHFYVENGRNIGPSPYEFFIGNPKSSSSYGCMAPVIEKALCACLGDSNAVKNISGTSLEEICDQYIDKDVPVILWATINMLETNPKNSWYLSDGTRFTWPGNEHCMLLVGYDETRYYFNDPYAGKLVAYDKTLTEDRFAELGMQALILLP